MRCWHQNVQLQGVNACPCVRENPREDQQPSEPYSVVGTRIPRVREYRPAADGVNSLTLIPTLRSFLHSVAYLLFQKGPGTFVGELHN